MLSGVVEFDDAYFGGPKAGSKRGRGTEKAKVFVALSLDKRGNPQYLKMSVTKNIKQASVRKFAKNAIQSKWLKSLNQESKRRNEKTSQITIGFVLPLFR